MNVIFYENKNFEQPADVNCESYVNHYIRLVVFNVDRGLYIVFENHPGTISSNKTSVSVVKNKSDFNTDRNYVNQDANLYLEFNVSIFEVFDIQMDKLIVDILKKLDDGIKEQWKQYNDSSNKLFQILKQQEITSYQSRLAATYLELKKLYNLINYWNITHKWSIDSELVKGDSLHKGGY